MAAPRHDTVAARWAETHREPRPGACQVNLVTAAFPRSDQA